MAHWSFWEWLGFAVLWVAAIILAIDQGLRMAPDTRQKLGLTFTDRPVWAFAPLVLLLIATAILVGNEIWGTTQTEISRNDQAGIAGPEGRIGPQGISGPPDPKVAEALRALISIRELEIGLVPLHSDFDSLNGPSRPIRAPMARADQPVKITVQRY
jgi:hypothetical protein